jgi:hypothetical protein
MRKTHKRTAIIATSLTGIVITGVAFAAWTATGVGSGAAKATTMTVTVESATAPAGDLFPNGTAGDLVVQVKNNNSGSIKVTGVVIDPAFPTSKGAGCTTPGPDLTLAGATAALTTGYPLDADRTITAGASKSFTLDGVLTMGGAADNSCQGQTLTFPVQVTAVTP